MCTYLVDKIYENEITLKTHSTILFYATWFAFSDGKNTVYNSEEIHCVTSRLMANKRNLQTRKGHLNKITQYEGMGE